MKNSIAFNTVSKEQFLQYHSVVDKKMNQVNSLRAFYLLVLGSIAELSLIVFYDLPRIMNSASEDSLPLFYLILHIILFAMSLFGVILSRIYMKGEKTDADEMRMVRVSILIPIVYLSSLALINGLDQQTINSSITIYVTFVLITSVFLIIRPKWSLLIFGLSHIVFIISMIVFQPDNNIVLLNIINGSIIVICAFLISFFTFSAFFDQQINKYLLEEANNKLESLSNTDYLTKIYNRRFGIKRLEEAFSLSKRSKIPFGILIIDLDDFKKVNDLYGHLVGDDTLVKFVELIENNIRTEDVFVRYGGEEFLLILPNSDTNAVRITGEKLRNKIKEHGFKIHGHEFNISISLGGISFPEYKCEALLDLIEKADKNLYVSKNSGKDKVTI